MGRVEPLGKIVKKWIGQGEDIFSTAQRLKKIPLFSYITPEICAKEYLKYMGRHQNSKTSESLITLVKKKQKIHLFGEVGTGKSFTVNNLAEKMGLTLITSYARSEEDLAKDFGDYPFSEDGDLLFLLEGDGYYWRRYGLVKNYIKDSKFPIIIITVGKDKPTKYITKLVKQVKTFPPTRADVLTLATALIPNDDSVRSYNIQEIYDKDWRKVWRNILYERKHTESKIVKPEQLDAKRLAYAITKGTATIKDFDRCIHPLSFVLNWLGYNAANFWSGKDLLRNLDIISWCDANKYNLKPIYLKSALVNDLTVNPDVKGYLKFPPFKRNKEEADTPIDEEFTVSHMKKKPKKKLKKSKSKLVDDGKEVMLDFITHIGAWDMDKKVEADEEDDIGDFLLI